MSYFDNPIVLSDESLKLNNALAKASLDKRKQEIENQYMPDKMRLANENSMLQNQYYGPNMESQIGERNALTNKYNTMTPLEAEKLRIENNFRPQTIQSDINYKNMGGGRGGVDQKALGGLQNQILMDNPGIDPIRANQIASAALSGDETLPNGEPVPKLSGIAQDYVTKIHKRNSNAALQTQAANMDVLASDLNDIDITPVKAFAGIKGKLNYGKYAADMASGRPVPQEFRQYLAFKDVTSNFAMDSLRKGFGTSVVPGYVYATLGKASNPNSSWWYDPEQVETEWKATKEWISKNAKKYKTKAEHGATANISSSNNNDLSQLSDAELMRIANGQ